MKTLDEIKEEVSFKYNFLSWDDLMDDVYSKAYEDPEKYYDEASKRYAQSVAEDLRERIVKEVRTKEGARFTCSNDRLVRYKEMVVDKDSIRNVEIILP